MGVDLMLKEYRLQPSSGPALWMVEGPRNGPPLLLAHGFSNRWQFFESILPVLLPDWQVFSFDFSGHGRSERQPQGYTAYHFYLDMEAVLISLPPQPVTIVGHSMGGNIGLHLAQRHPERVKTMVTGDASINLAVHIKKMNERRQVKLFGLRRKLAGRPMDELIRRGLPPDKAEELSQLDPAVMDHHAIARSEDFFIHVQDIDFDQIHCPILLTQANPEKGGLLQDEEIAPVLAAHPEFHFERFDLGHDLEIEKGMESPFWQAALQFLSQHQQ